MPKLKTHSGLKKRVRFTATGKIKYKKSGLRHLLTGMSPDRGRSLRKLTIMNSTQAKIIKQLMNT